jgi:hypothetical protein
VQRERTAYSAVHAELQATLTVVTVWLVPTSGGEALVALGMSNNVFYAYMMLIPVSRIQCCNLYGGSCPEESGQSARIFRSLLRR